MKNLTIILFATVIAIVCQLAHAQKIGVTDGIKPLNEIRIAITDKKTTNLIFPFSIKSVDIGSPGILVQKAKNVENLLQVKAANEYIENTNLTVVTSDGKLHSFNVFYEQYPPYVNLNIDGGGSETLAKFTDPKDDERLISKNIDGIADKKRTLWGVSDSQYGVDLTLKGIFIQDDHLYFQLEIDNMTLIKYDIGQFRIYIRDLTKAKRTASQELELLPESIRGNTRFVAGFSSQTIVFSLSKFTIPDKKYLFIEFLEENGGRHLKLKVNNKKLVQAHPVW